MILGGYGQSVLVPFTTAIGLFKCHCWASAFVCGYVLCDRFVSMLVYIVCLAGLASVFCTQFYTLRLNFLPVEGFVCRQTGTENGTHLAVLSSSSQANRQEITFNLRLACHTITYTWLTIAAAGMSALVKESTLVVLRVLFKVVVDSK